MSGILAARQVAQFSHEGHGPGELPSTPALQGRDHRLPSPGLDLLGQYVFPSLEVCGGRVDRADVFLADTRLRRGGTDPFGAPAQMGWAPRGSARLADVLPEPEGCAAARGGREIPPGLFTGAGEITHGFIVHRGDLDACAITRAHQASQWHGVPTVGLDAVAGRLGHERGRDDPAGLAFFRAIAGEPVAPGSRCIDEDQGRGFCLSRAHELIHVALPSANAAQVEDLSVVIVGDIGHHNRCRMDIHADVQRARLGQG